MWDLQLAFENFSPDLDISEPLVDSEFIIELLCRHFPDVPREHLVDKLADVIALEQACQSFAIRPR